MDELKAEILDPGKGEDHTKEEDKSPHEEALPPVTGVGWKDEDVIIPSPEVLKARATSGSQDSGPKMPSPVTAVTMMDGWESIVGWEEIIASYEHILAEADAQGANLAPQAATEAVPQAPEPAAKLQGEARPSTPSPVQAPRAPAAVASSAWKPAAPAQEAGASSWRPKEGATAAASPWKPDTAPSETSSPWKPEPPPQEASPLEASPAPGSPEALSEVRAPARESGPKRPQDDARTNEDNLPPDTLKRVAVLMRKGDLEKSKRVLELWLKSRPTDIVALKMLAICDEAIGAKDVSSTAARIPRAKVPGPDPRAIPRVDMSKLMGAGSSLTPKDAFILSRIDGHTRVEQLAHLVPELSQEELTGLLVKSWKAGIVSFKR